MSGRKAPSDDTREAHAGPLSLAIPVFYHGAPLVVTSLWRRIKDTVRLWAMATSKLMKKIREKAAAKSSRARQAVARNKAALVRATAPVAGFVGGGVAGVIDSQITDPHLGETGVTIGQLVTAGGTAALGVVFRKDVTASTLLLGAASGAAGAAGYGVGGKIVAHMGAE